MLGPGLGMWEAESSVMTVTLGVMAVVPTAGRGCAGLTCRGLGSAAVQAAQAGGPRWRAQRGERETSVAQCLKTT